MLVYDRAGLPLYVSDPVGSDPSPPGEILQRVMASGEPATVDRDLDGEEVVSVVRALRSEEGIVVAPSRSRSPWLSRPRSWTGCGSG
ncbi:MAG TPA: hypothetical protein VE173_12890 [Longimicrobiales bacterium]|nr:hypothetical protein [Longimicrobiales bacterium]